MRSGIDPHANAARLTQLARDAVGQGAVMLFTPEMTGLLDRDRKRASDHLKSEATDVVLAAAKAVAEETGLWIALGSLALSGERTDERLANRSLVIAPDGRVVARYDKMHLFDVDLASGESWRESAAYGAGDVAVVVNSPVGMLGLSICYDIRFPALYQALTGAGATILTVPAAFTVPTGKAHWHILLRARAIETAAWVVAAAQSGLHEDGRETFGHSLVIDPWGNVVLDMGEEEGLGFAEIDPDAVFKARSRVPVINHRRDIPEVMVLA